jgi:predicted nucleic acid-binding protein
MGESIDKLGAGEREAIALSLEYRSDSLLLIDEARRRREAASREIRFMGILGLLDLAAERGLIDLPRAIESLLQTTFYVTPVLLKNLLDRHAERKKSTH